MVLGYFDASLRKDIANKMRPLETNGLSGRQEVCKDERVRRLCYGSSMCLMW